MIIKLSNSTIGGGIVVVVVVVVVLGGGVFVVVVVRGWVVIVVLLVVVVVVVVVAGGRGGIVVAIVVIRGKEVVAIAGNFLSKMRGSGGIGYSSRRGSCCHGDIIRDSGGCCKSGSGFCCADTRCC